MDRTTVCEYSPAEKRCLNPCYDGIWRISNLQLQCPENMGVLIHIIKETSITQQQLYNDENRWQS